MQSPEAMPLLHSFTPGGSSSVRATTSGYPLTANAKHTVLVEWSMTPVGSNTLVMTIDGANYTYSETSLPTIAGTLGGLGIPYTTTPGTYATTNVFYIDNLQVYNAWIY